MAVPKRRQSNSRRKKRRTHDALPTIHLGSCPQCGSAKRAHRVCASCGYYKGRQVQAAKSL